MMTTSTLRPRSPLAVLPFLALALALALAFAVPRHAIADTVLIVVSGEGRDQGRSRPGFEMDELSQAWQVFRDNGLEIEIASPRGGPVEADAYNPNAPYNAEMLADSAVMARLADTRPIAELAAADYAAVYVVGGKGAMFDLPGDPALARLVGAIHDRGGIVAAVCHGPAALVDVRLSDGSLLVAGRSMTGFSNAEEAIFGKKWAAEYPFLLEDAMRERGARWDNAALMMPRLVVDDRLITGQNPFSTIAVAEAIVRATGRTPVARVPGRDELSLRLVERLLAGETDAVRAELAADVSRYHPQLIAMLGFYQLKVATDDDGARDALAIMELAAAHFDDPRLTVGIAEGHWRLGHAQRARELLHGVLASSPDLAEARQLMERIDRT
jgi:putative intracellular protease/amidase